MKKAAKTSFKPALGMILLLSIVSCLNVNKSPALNQPQEYAVANRGCEQSQEQPSGKPKPYHINNGSFEDKRFDSWDTDISGGDQIGLTKDDSYYCAQALQMKTTGASRSSVSIWQTLPVGESDGQPKAGDKVEAGVWVKLPKEGVPLRKGSFKLQVEGVLDNGEKKLLAESADLSDISKDTWVYVMAQPVQDRTVTAAMKSVVVSVQNSLQGLTTIDFLEAGPQFSITGNPQKYAMIEYQPWYGTEAENWDHWAWSKGGGPAHNPEVIHDNGQRDTATFYYPLIGAYNSKDEDLLRYHVNMIKAMGIDCIMVDWYAALQPDFVETFDTLVKIADESDMKIMPLYEPKIHMDNWIPHKTRDEKIESIIKDIIDIEKRYADHKSILKIRGRTVIGTFGTTNNGLKSADWDRIMAAVHEKGYRPFMMGDVVASSNSSFLSSFDSMFNWVFGSTKFNDDNSDSKVVSFSEQTNKKTQNWVKADPEHRLGVGIVWPGFNDSGVNGWGSGKSRVIPYSSTFYTDAWEGMLRNHFDWVLIATFNDWNESTAIEPSKELGYSRAITTQNYVEKFKGLKPIDDSLFKSITDAYLSDKKVSHYN